MPKHKTEKQIVYTTIVGKPFILREVYHNGVSVYQQIKTEKELPDEVRVLLKVRKNQKFNNI